MTALASHYARALADAVFAAGSGLSPQDAVAQLRSVESAVAASNELQHVLLSPAVTKDRKKAVLARVSDAMGLHRIIRNFLLVLVSHRRIKELQAIRREFEVAVDERLGWIPAEITSAKDLNTQEREQIERVLGTKLGKFVRAHYKVDPAILAGVKAEVASREYDATLRGKLENLRERLIAGL